MTYNGRMPQETKAHIDHERRDDLAQGARLEAGDPRMAGAVQAAIHYRGDVTVTLASTGRAIEGYIFDGRHLADPARALLRIIPRDDGEHVSIPLADVAALEFTGRDTAAGKSFETWMKKYVHKKLAGEAADLPAEPLDDE
jgi:hypothetical protein